MRDVALGLTLQLPFETWRGLVVSLLTVVLMRSCLIRLFGDFHTMISICIYATSVWCFVLLSYI